MHATKPLLEFRPVEAPSSATPGARVYVLMPTLEELVGHVGFGRHDPICLPGAPRPFDPLSFFARAKRAGVVLH